MTAIREQLEALGFKSMKPIPPPINPQRYLWVSVCHAKTYDKIKPQLVPLFKQRKAVMVLTHH